MLWFFVRFWEGGYWEIFCGGDFWEHFGHCSNYRGRWIGVHLPVDNANLWQRLFFLQNMGRTCCVQKLFWMSETISVQNMYSMKNLLSYCGLIDAKIRAPDKNLLVPSTFFNLVELKNWEYLAHHHLDIFFVYYDIL